MAKETRFRFAIHDPIRDLVSPAWTITTSGENVYVFCRALGHRIKGSIHSRTGQCHLKYDKAFAERNAAVLPDWVINEWFYEKAGPWVEPFRIVFPSTVIDAPRSTLPANKPIELFPIDPGTDATFVRLVVVGPQTQIVHEPALLHPFGDGSRFCLAVSHGDMPNLRMPNPTPVRFFTGVNPNDLHRHHKLRGIVLGDDGNTKCLFNVPTNVTAKSN